MTDRTLRFPYAGRGTAAPFFLSPLVAALYLILSAPASAELYFAPELIAGGPQGVADLSHFTQAGRQPAGTYDVEVYLNNKFVAQRPVTFSRVVVEEHDVIVQPDSKEALTGNAQQKAAGKAQASDDAV